MSRDLIFTVEFHVKPEHRAEFLDALLQVLNQMAKESTFVSTHLQQVAGDPNRLMIYERWAEPDMASFIDNQLKAKAYRLDYEQRLGDWLAEERKFTVFEPLGEWTR